MNRLIVYLFVVFSLGVSFNVNADDYPFNASVNNQYDYATQFLKDGDYLGGEKAFKKFIEINPNHKLAGYAQYWYAESFRIRQLYTDAAAAYLEGYQKYPQGEKAPLNLLKLGMMLVQVGEKEAGCKMINGVEKQYPKAKQSVIQKAKYEAKKLKCDDREKNFLTEIPKLSKKFDIETVKAEPSQTQNSVEQVSLKLNKNEVDTLFSSVNSCWSIPLGLPYDEDLSIKIKVKFDPSGNAIKTEIIDHAKINKKGNAYLKVLAESALRAIKLCSPIIAPKDKYNLWKEVVFNFDAKDVLNGTESKVTKIAKNNLLKKSIETKIVKTEPSKPQKKIAKTNNSNQNETIKKKVNTDKEAPVIEIADTITVKDTTYEIAGMVKDKSDTVYIEIDGQTILAENGKFKFQKYSPVDHQLQIVAIDQWGNRSEPKIVDVKINIQVAGTSNVIEPLNPSKLRAKIDRNKVALVIGVEKYENSPSAKYASLDAKYFKDYARKVFGVREDNINLLTDEEANLSKTNSAFFKWLPSKIKSNQTDLIIFYAGHGLASTDGKEKYILPFNADPDLLSRTAISRNEIFDQIISLNPRSVTIFFDTCYSGVSRDEQMLLASARPLRVIADDEEQLPDNFTIFSASKNDQISSGLSDAKHGIFSYFLMKGLEGNADLNGDRKLTNNELLTYLDDNVSEKALDLGRQQNPTLSGNPEQVLARY
ncbi:tol-pal system protein YbgF [Candidatus Pelagibacter sp.]|uniref:tol-pal system protein YbgF n=1 Tax=Candidatus Pelagibacter sp. TaxID=2024849 RepID=UPI003F834F36